jgi:hypothetical protein
MKQTIEITDYTRVIPRDFFNEAKLLKGMGLLALKILDCQLPEKIGIDITNEEGEPFDIQLTEDGLLFVANYRVTVNNVDVFVGSRYNSKSNFSLVAVVDYCEYLIFEEDGKFSEEFITQFQNL